MVSEGPYAMGPFILPMMGVVSGAAGSTGCAAASGTTTIASGYDPSIIATIIATSVGGTLSSCTTPAVVDTTSAASRSTSSDVGSEIASITICSMISEGTPLASPTT